MLQKNFALALVAIGARLVHAGPDMGTCSIKIMTDFPSYLLWYSDLGGGLGLAAKLNASALITEVQAGALLDGWSASHIPIEYTEWQNTATLNQIDWSAMSPTYTEYYDHKARCKNDGTMVSDLEFHGVPCVTVEVFDTSAKTSSLKLLRKYSYNFVCGMTNSGVSRLDIIKSGGQESGAFAVMSPGKCADLAGATAFTAARVQKFMPSYMLEDSEMPGMTNFQMLCTFATVARTHMINDYASYSPEQCSDVTEEQIRQLPATTGTGNWMYQIADYLSQTCFGDVFTTSVAVASMPIPENVDVTYYILRAMMMGPFEMATVNCVDGTPGLNPIVAANYSKESAMWSCIGDPTGAACNRAATLASWPSPQPNQWFDAFVAGTTTPQPEDLWIKSSLSCSTSSTAAPAKIKVREGFVPCCSEDVTCDMQMPVDYVLGSGYAVAQAIV